MSQPRRFKLGLIVAITLVAALFRLYKIDILPPGETYDPAFYGLDALAILRGETPIFFETNYGREPMFSYLVAACVALLGVGSQAIHVASAIVGIATVPAVYLVAEEVFSQDRGWLGRFGGLTAALALALSHWHLHWSRYGVRAILTPLFAAVTIYFLWRGVRTQRWGAFAGCGFFLGLGLYTYQATRLLPFLVVLGFGYVAWKRASLSKRDAWHVTILIAVALAVFAPLGAYFLTHPGSASERIDQVFVLEDAQGMDELTSLAQGIKDTLLVFSFRGDDQPTVNLPGCPALNPFCSIAFALGIVISLVRIKEPPFFLLLAWLGVMSVPGVLAQHGPTAKRIIGTLPAVAALIAVGALVPLDALRSWATQGPSPRARRSRFMCAGAWAAVIAAGFLYSGVATYRHYFIAWGQDPALFTHFEVGLSAIGQYIGQRPPEEQIYISPVYVAHPSIVYNSGERPGVKGYHGHHCIVLPNQASHDTTYVVVPGEDERSVELLQTYLPSGEIIAEGPLHYQQPYFLAYHVPAGTRPQVTPAHPLQVNWDDKIRLLGYDIVPKKDGGSMRVRLYYTALATIESDYTAFVQLIGPHNPASDSPVWSQNDSEPCRRYRPTSSWSADEILIDDLMLSIPTDRPTHEDYELIVGFYNWRTLARLPVLDLAGQAVGDHAVLDQGDPLSGEAQ